MLRPVLGALLIPVTIAVYFAGGILLFGAHDSPWWIALGFAWAFLVLGGGVWLSACLMTRDL